MVRRKFYEYQAIVVDDRGHLDDPEFLAVLNEWGARGFKRSEEAPKGSKQLVVLMERETEREVEGDA